MGFLNFGHARSNKPVLYRYGSYITTSPQNEWRGTSPPIYNNTTCHNTSQTSTDASSSAFSLVRLSGRTNKTGDSSKAISVPAQVWLLGSPVEMTIQDGPRLV